MRGLVRSLLFLGLCAGFSDTVAAPLPKEYVDVGTPGDFVFAMWATGDGDQSAAQLHCAASADTNKPSPPPENSQLPYDFRITDLGTPAGYYLYLNDDDTKTGNERIAVQFQHRDILEASGYESLADGVYDSHAHNGQFRNCGSGDNSEISIAISTTELGKARAGSYTGNFEVQIRGGVSGTTTSSANFQTTIDVAAQVRISSLDNILLGAWSGVGNLTADETFCVYSNNLAAGYNITITSPNQDVSSNFFVVNAGSTRQVPFTLAFKDDTTAGAGTAVGAVPISGNGDNNASDCGGLDNAKLTVTLIQADLELASTDSYSDTLTLLVAPE